MPLLIFQLWFSLLTPADLANGVKLNGNWQSCDGAERVYDHFEKGKHLWSLHMGPREEFALYRGYGPDGADHSHEGPDNLLAPNFTVGGGKWRSRGHWLVKPLRLQLDITQAGGSREECESFIVLVKQLPRKAGKWDEAQRAEDPGR